MRLTIFSLFSATLLIGVADADLKECEDLRKKFLDCTTKAHETFKEQIGTGGDGRPDFAARKACNYMESAIQTCGGSLEGECFTHAEILKMKDRTTDSILKQLKSSLQEWDSNKCPAVKSHIERLKQNVDSEATFSETRGNLQVSSSSSSSSSMEKAGEASLKEAGTDVDWQIIGPIIAVVALALVALLIVLVVCCLRKKYREVPQQDSRLMGQMKDKV